MSEIRNNLKPDEQEPVSWYKTHAFPFGVVRRPSHVLRREL